MTRSAVRARPKAFYVGAREWLMTTPNPEGFEFDRERGFYGASWALGIAMEALWAAVFTNATRFDLPQQDCMCEVFGACLPARLGAAGAYAPFYALGG